MYASYNYYESGYLKSRDPKLSEDDFPFWEKQAERVLNQYTFSRLVSNFGLRKRSERGKKNWEAPDWLSAPSVFIKQHSGGLYHFW